MNNVKMVLLANYKKEKHKEILRDNKNPTYKNLLNDGNMTGSQHHQQRFIYGDFVYWAIYIPQKQGWVVIEHSKYIPEDDDYCG